MVVVVGVAVAVVVVVLVAVVDVVDVVVVEVVVGLRVAGLGRLSAGANMAMKPFVKRNFRDKCVVFARNLKFLHLTQ